MHRKSQNNVPEPALLRGTLDMLILRALQHGPTHGYGIAKRIHRMSGDHLLVEEGSLYPALHRLARRGAVQSTWGLSENNRRARFYELTRTGESKLHHDIGAWQRLSELIGRILAAEPEPENH